MVHAVFSRFPLAVGRSGGVSVNSQSPGMARAAEIVYASQFNESKWGTQMSDPHDIEDEPTISEVRRDLVRQSLEGVFGKTPPNSGQFKSLLEATTQAAADCAIERGVNPWDFECGDGQVASMIVENLYNAVNLREYEDDETGSVGSRQNTTVWRHHDFLLEDVKSKRAPDMNRFEIESAVSQYLDEPWRCERLDRLLVDLLVAVELVAFTNEAIHHPGWAPDLVRQSPLRQKHPLRLFLGEVILEYVCVGAVCGGLYWLTLQGWMSDGWAFGIGGVIVALMLLYQIYMLFHLPFEWHQHNKNKNEVVDRIGSMLLVYSALKSDGPISARHIVQRLNDTAKDGVVWPAPVFTLLDDIERRSGRF